MGTEPRLSPLTLALTLLFPVPANSRDYGTETKDTVVKDSARHMTAEPSLAGETLYSMEDDDTDLRGADGREEQEKLDVEGEAERADGKRMKA